ncbi:MAG TPA: glutamate-cysteine ligase family protein [Nitriliruptorales bacterium]
MPTTEDQRRLRQADVLDVVEAAGFPTTAPDGDALGIEAEWFPIRRHPGGSRRILLRERDGVEDLLAAASVPTDVRLQFEPGAQVEVATVPHANVADAIASLDLAAGALGRAAAEQQIVLVAAGIDLWHPRLPPQQATQPRYPAMASYLAARGPAGATMMRHTASLQLNVDLGRGDVAAERWTVSMLAAPLSLATFAASPDVAGTTVSRRGHNWRAVDPTRTGIPPAFVTEPGWTPAQQLAHAAVNADVMLFLGADGTATPGTPGWTFGDWIGQGHPTHGWPTASDLRYHLTTLFHEVRPRGWLELRSLDALPPRWREPAVVLHAGLLLDARARQRVLEILEPQRPSLPVLLRRAAERGVADPSLCALAVETWSFALDGARRMEGVLPPGAIGRTEQFIDEFTLRGRCPADALRDALRRDPGAAMALVTEPAQHVPSMA